MQQRLRRRCADADPGAGINKAGSGRERGSVEKGDAVRRLRTGIRAAIGDRQDAGRLGSEVDA